MSVASFSLIQIGLVAAGGAGGAVLRFVLGRAVSPMPVLAGGFPWPTFLANVLGSLAMGLLVGWLARHGSESLRLLLGVGLLGGFTTFSAFSLECIQLIERGAPGLAALYAGLSIIFGIGALALGMTIMRTAA